MTTLRPPPAQFTIVMKGAEIVRPSASSVGFSRYKAADDGVIFEGTDPFVTVERLIEIAKRIKEEARGQRKRDRL